MAQSDESIMLRESCEKLLVKVNELNSSTVDMDVKKGEYIILVQYLDPLALYLTSINIIVDQIGKDNKSTTQVAAAPPATLMSISQLRGVYTAVELIWRWGISPVIRCRLNGKETSSYPKSLLVSESLVLTVENLIPTSSITFQNAKNIEALLRVMVRTCTSFVFRGMMLGRNLKRIVIATLSVIDICGTMESSSEGAINDITALQMYSSSLLYQIAGSRAPYVDTISVVEALRYASLLGSPTVQKRASACLVNVLLLPNGLRAVLAVYLDGVAESSQTLPRIVRIARLVTSCPAALPASVYTSVLEGSSSNETLLTSEDIFFQNIGSQLTPLITALHTQRNDQVALTTAMLVLFRICHLSPSVAVDVVLRPLFKELLVFLQQSSLSTRSGSALGVMPLVSEEEVLSNVQLLAILVTAHPLSASVVSCLFQAQLAFAIFSLGSFIFSSHPLCDMKQIVVSICSEIIKHSDALYTSQCIEMVMARSSSVEFASGPSGGVIIQSKFRASDGGTGVNLLSLLGASSSIQSDGMRVGVRNEESGEEYAEVMRAIMLSAALTESDPDDNTHPLGGESTAVMMSEIVQRAKGICQLLVSVYPSPQGNDGKDALSKKAATGKPTGQKKTCPDQKSSDTDEIDTSAPTFGHVPSVMFIRLLRAYLGVGSILCQKQEKGISGVSPSQDTSQNSDTDLAPHICGMLLLVVKSHIPLELLLQDGYEIIVLLGSFLEAHSKIICDGKNWMSAVRIPAPVDALRAEPSFPAESKLLSMAAGIDEESPEEEGDMVTTVLALLASMLQMGTSRRPPKEEEALREIVLPALQVIARGDRDSLIGQTAADVSLLIMVRGVAENVPPPRPSPPSDGNTAFSRICANADSFLHDSSPAMRGLGVRNIIVALREPEEALTPEDLLLGKKMLLKLLSDPDSFVYLNVIHALCRLVDHNRKSLLPALLRIFESPEGLDSEEQLSVRDRAALAEALSFAIRRAGDAAPIYVPDIVRICVKLCRNRIVLSDASCRVDLDKRKITSDEGQDGDCVACTIGVGSSTEKIAQQADLVFLRQSAFSLLAEAIGVAGWSASRHMRDLMDVAMGTLRLEDGRNQESVSVRRSAAFLLKYTLQGLDSKIFQIADAGNHLKDIYRILKVASRDVDKVIAFQAETGLYVLDNLMRSQLFFSESRLMGDDLPKIRVIG